MRAATATAIVASAIALVTAGCAASTGSVKAGGGAGSSASQSAGGGSSTGASGGGTTTGPGMGGTASTPPAAEARARAAAASCPTDPRINPLTLPTAKAVPAGFQVSFVLRCKILSPGGSPTTLVAERSTSSPAELIAALQAPSVPRAKVVCPMMVVQVPYFALVDPTGNTIVPKIPLDNCGKPQNSVLTALNRLQFTEITSRPLK